MIKLTIFCFLHKFVFKMKMGDTKSIFMYSILINDYKFDILFLFLRYNNSSLCFYLLSLKMLNKDGQWT